MATETTLGSLENAVLTSTLVRNEAKNIETHFGARVTIPYDIFEVRAFDFAMGVTLLFRAGTHQKLAKFNNAAVRLPASGRIGACGYKQ